MHIWLSKSVIGDAFDKSNVRMYNNVMYKLFVIVVIAILGFLFWRMGPGNDVTYYENRDNTRTETIR